LTEKIIFLLFQNDQPHNMIKNVTKLQDSSYASTKKNQSLGLINDLNASLAFLPIVKFHNTSFALIPVPFSCAMGSMKLCVALLLPLVRFGILFV
jgi:hypothetical protein